MSDCVSERMRWLVKQFGQRNEDQNAHRKVIDHVRKTRGHLLQVKSSGRRLKANAVVSATPVVMAKARAQIIFFMASPFISCVGIARTGQGSQ